ncbi:MAG: hypothetical protein ABIJ41_05370 [Candidatus Omnitrophota bacterium]
MSPGILNNDILLAMKGPGIKTIRLYLTIAVLLFVLGGCSTVNFSANYYTPPKNYQQEVQGLFNKLIRRFAPDHAYALRVVSENESKGLKGIPAISNQTVILPDNFIKYVYQNYYDDRNIIFTCVIVHELCHDVYNLPSSPAEIHFKTDAQAISLLGTQDQDTAKYYYQSLRVMKNYWFARKGVAGHTLNAGWNVLSAASMAFGGPGVFIDWFSTDLEKRLQMIARHYGIKRSSAFERSPGLGK